MSTKREDVYHRVSNPLLALAYAEHERDLNVAEHILQNAVNDENRYRAAHEAAAASARKAKARVHAVRQTFADSAAAALGLHVETMCTERFAYMDDGVVTIVVRPLAVDA